MKLIKYFFAVVTAMLVFTSCEEDMVDVIPTTKATFNLKTLSGDFEEVKFSDLVVTFTELNTKETKTVKVTNFPNLVIKLKRGSYEVSVIGNVKYILDGVQQTGKVGAFKSELNFTKKTENVDIQLILKAFSKDFVVEEIFFTGTKTPEGKVYNGDKYIKLYNNTDEVLYADGLLISMSTFLTTRKTEYTPDIMGEAFTAYSVIQVPGSGKEHPVKPGESFLIAENGINNLENNSNSIDLSKADVEIDILSLNPKIKGDVNSPTVEDATNVFGKFGFLIHDRGNRSYVIARLPKGMTNKQFIKDNSYKYQYQIGKKLMERDALKIPNSWIVDAVNLSVKTKFQWIVTDPSLDSGWTYCAEKSRDEDRYGKSVRRKVLQEVDGKRILMDTNNSTNDFDIKVKPSLMK